MLSGSMPNFGDLLGVGRDRDEMPRDRLLVAERAQAPGARGVRVGQRLERREGLRADDEQRLGGVEIAHRLDEIGAVDVGDEAERQVALAVVAQRLVGHHRAEVGAADADVDDVADALAGVAGPVAAAHRARQNAAMRSSTACTSATTFVPSTTMRSPGGARSATCSTARCSVVLIVVAAEHRGDALAQAAARRRARAAARSVSSVMRFFE